MARRRSALGAEAVTPETQAPGGAADGFVTYDELGGPDLDAARWNPARLCMVCLRFRLKPRRASLSGSDTWPVRASTSMTDAELPRQEPA